MSWFLQLAGYINHCSYCTTQNIWWILLCFSGTFRRIGLNGRDSLLGEEVAVMAENAVPLHCFVTARRVVSFQVSRWLDQHQFALGGSWYYLDRKRA